MIKSIKILATSLSAEYIVTNFCKTNAPLLREKGILLLSPADLLKKNLENNTLYFDYFLSWQLLTQKPLPYSENFISSEKLQKKIKEFSACEELIIICPRVLLTEKGTEFFTCIAESLRKSDDAAQEHGPIPIEIFFLDQTLDAEIETRHKILNIMGGVLALNSCVHSPIRGMQDPFLHVMPHTEREQNCIAFFGNIKNFYCNTSHIYTNTVAREQDIIPTFLDWLKLPSLHDTWIPKFLSFSFAPEVLAFIIHTRIYYNLAKYNWLSQEAFIQYKADIKKPFTYLLPYWAQKVYENYNNKYPHDQKDVNVLNSEAQKEKRNVADVPISVSSEDAKVLVTLLTQCFRQELIKNIKHDTLQYQSQSIRNIFAELLKIENKITKEEYEKLIKKPQGVILTGDERAQHNQAQEPKLTVITQTYNHEEFIEKQILSVIKQITNFPVSHIIIDDCSSDKTREIILKYAKKYPHITPILRDFNKLPFATCNAFDRVDTPYVAMCDGDDYFADPQKLQLQVDSLDAHSDYALSFHIVHFVYLDNPENKNSNAKLAWRPKFYPLELPRKAPFCRVTDLLKVNLIQTNSVVYRWRFRQGLPAWFARHISPGDWYIHLVHAQLGKVGFIPRCMSVYVRHPKGLYAETARNVAVHRRKFAAAEIAFFEAVNLHFEGRYHKIMRNNEASVFYTLALDALHTNDNSHYISLCEKFPDLAKEFNITPKKLQTVLDTKQIDYNA